MFGGSSKRGILIGLGGLVAGLLRANTDLVLGQHAEIVLERRAMGVESCLVGCASTPAPDKEDGDAGGEEEEAKYDHNHRSQVGAMVAHKTGLVSEPVYCPLSIHCIGVSWERLAGGSQNSGVVVRSMGQFWVVRVLGPSRDAGLRCVCY